MILVVFWWLHITKCFRSLRRCKSFVCVRVCVCVQNSEILSSASCYSETLHSAMDARHEEQKPSSRGRLWYSLRLSTISIRSTLGSPALRWRSFINRRNEGRSTGTPLFGLEGTLSYPTFQDTGEYVPPGPCYRSSRRTPHPSYMGMCYPTIFPRLLNRYPTTTLALGPSGLDRTSWADPTALAPKLKSETPPMSDWLSTDN